MRAACDDDMPGKRPTATSVERCSTSSADRCVCTASPSRVHIGASRRAVSGSRPCLEAWVATSANSESRAREPFAIHTSASWVTPSSASAPHSRRKADASVSPRGSRSMRSAKPRLPSSSSECVRSSDAGRVNRGVSTAMHAVTRRWHTARRRVAPERSSRAWASSTSSVVPGAGRSSITADPASGASSTPRTSWVGTSRRASACATRLIVTVFPTPTGPTRTTGVPAARCRAITSGSAACRTVRGVLSPPRKSAIAPIATPSWNRSHITIAALTQTGSGASTQDYSLSRAQ